MLIALNTTIAAKQRTGTGHYAANLAAAIMQADHDHDLVIYCNHEMHDWFANRRNGYAVKIKGVEFASAIQRIYWEQTQLTRYLKKSGVDLLHSMAFTSPWINSVKSVVTVHDLTFKKYPETIPLSKRVYYKTVFPRSLKLADAIITPSESVKNELLETYRLNEEKVFPVAEAADDVFGNIPDEQTVAATITSLGISAPYFLTVGTLEPRKNMGTLIKAFAKLKAKTGLPHQLVIVGKGGWLQAKANRSDEIKDVVFTDYVPQGQLPALYAGAELFLFPSLYEGFGLPLLEALACATPVLASDISTHREICGEAAKFVPAGDVGQWTGAMLKILLDDDMKTKMIKKGLQRVRAFSWQKAAEKTLEVYTRVMAMSINSV